MFLVISSGYLQVGLKIEIKKSKFGIAPLKSCIPDTSGIATGSLCQAVLQNMYVPDTSGIRAQC